MPKANELEGFRIGNYFITFPPGDFIKEDDNGNLYAEVDIYGIQKDGSAEKLPPNKISPEMNQVINDEINKIIQEALDMEKGKIDEQN